MHLIHFHRHCYGGLEYSSEQDEPFRQRHERVNALTIHKALTTQILYELGSQHVPVAQFTFTGPKMSRHGFFTSFSWSHYPPVLCKQAFIKPSPVTSFESLLLPDRPCSQKTYSPGWLSLSSHDSDLLKHIILSSSIQRKDCVYENLPLKLVS